MIKLKKPQNSDFWWSKPEWAEFLIKFWEESDSIEYFDCYLLLQTVFCLCSQKNPQMNAVKRTIQLALSLDDSISWERDFKDTPILPFEDPTDPSDPVDPI